MSSQMQAYRWNDKPIGVKQGILFLLLAVVVAMLVLRFRSRFNAQADVHAFTQTRETRSRDQTVRDMEKQGVKVPGGSDRPPMIRGHADGYGSTPRSSSQRTIQERPLFDGMTATLEALIDRAFSSATGDVSAEATVLDLVPNGTLSGVEADTVRGAKLTGQFQPNFDTQRIQIQFRELTTADGRRYPVAGIAMDEDEKSVGVPADFSSGVGLRVLGATLGTAISTAEVVATSRVLQNESGEDGLITRQLDQAATDSAGHATSSISDEATRDLKNQKAVLSLPSGSRFRIKLRAISTPQGGVQ